MAGTELERAAHELGLRMAREIYADRAYERALQQFRAERMCTEYERLYRTLVAKERARDTAA